MVTENKEEIKKFSVLASEWHKPHGSFEMLHKMNKLRIQYILSNSDVVGKAILDVGCGGGILSEELSSLGGIVTAIDPSEESVKAAMENSKGNVTYINASLDEAVIRDKQFDIICIMEVIEHVNDPMEFVKLCSGMLAPGGKIFFSTLNKTIKSFLFGIVAAEYLLDLLPRKTHSWQAFLKPSTLNKFFLNAGLEIKDIRGLKYNFISDSWKLDKDISVNYIGFASLE
ncbi:3-demethylubiquinone-9 3-O-methyltransferase [Neorickettsia helminthoeca str. Oregon]|uniref:Ubiquinone biosynthesis O-methyltransferase n=1 Tax=Neorickettsia helminthoeca str. Oregon TaxID=1286528 RepID=X5HM75_9RICK|nr:bifunctional 2-polyprenyl-6-hydroxyphenol methylase/3-demethylubiquinol 3-O-methyltransferase UbiG [Neorickettsia helminthoeca]AHX11540.1 3-demethylubiquinone-9 3-O-methyltransferase [Neorickettsia helminthoeca str. Oregon]